LLSFARSATASRAGDVVTSRPGFPLRMVFLSIRQELRTCVQEAAPGRRFAALVKQVLRCVFAALFHCTGLTGPLLRRTLQSGRASLILGFHGTSDAPPGYFSRGHAIVNVHGQIRFLKKHLRAVTLEDIAQAIGQGDSPPVASFAVTFDDGLANNVIHAIPMLRELGVPATFFIPSAFIGSSRDLWVASLREIVRTWPERSIPEEPGWWPELPVGGEADRYAAFHRIKEVLKARDGRRQEILDRLADRAGGYIRPPERDRVVDLSLLRQMTRPEFSVGAHTRTHPILSSMDPDAVRTELEGCREDLERLLGLPVLDFAYPNGRFPDFNEDIRRLVAEAGYRCAVTTEPGTVRRGDDRLALRRCLPRNVPAFLAAFDLLTRAWADRRRQGDLAFPLARRLSCLAPRVAGPAS